MQLYNSRHVLLSIPDNFKVGQNWSRTIANVYYRRMFADVPNVFISSDGANR